MKLIRWTFIFFFLFGIVLLGIILTSKNPAFVALRSIVGLELAFRCTDPYAYYGWYPARFFDDPETQKLAKAIQKNDIPKIKKLVAQGANVNASGKEGRTPLYYAIGASNETFHCLLELGANPMLPGQYNTGQVRERYIFTYEKKNLNDYWYNSVLMELAVGKGDESEKIRSKGTVKSTKWKDALEFAKKYREGGKLPSDLLYYTTQTWWGGGRRVVEAIEAGADVHYQQHQASLVTLLVLRNVSVDSNVLKALRLMLQNGADMCAVSDIENYYRDDVCLFVAQNEFKGVEYEALVEEIERQGGDIELARSIYLQRKKELEERGEDPLLIPGMAKIDVSRTPPTERPWLDGVYEKRWFQEPEME